MINEYNNPTLLSCIFPNLLSFGINVLEITNKPIKVSLQMHIKQRLMNLDEAQYNNQMCLASKENFA
jgi:hypothetical protein